MEQLNFILPKVPRKPMRLPKVPTEPMQPVETPAARFERVSRKRLRNALRQLQAVGRLGGDTYVSSPAQRSKIVCALLDGVCDVRNALDGFRL
jgi:hypothetical protein